MKYTTEELTPCKKKVNISVEPDEVNAAINTAVKLQQRGIAMDGFRKGHVPADIIEKRFKGQLYHDACQDLINVHINTVFGELKVTPIAGVTVNDNPQLQRDTPLNYSIEFEHLPEVTLPNYEGLEVEQGEKKPTDDEIEALLTRMREQRAKFVPVDGNGPAVDGQYANIDMRVFVDGKSVDEVKNDGYDYLVGQHTVLPEIDTLIKTLKVDQSGESEVTFPADFFNKSLAGKKGTIKITVHAIKLRKPADLDEKFLKEMGCKDEAELRTRLSGFIKSQYDNLYRGNACTKLLEQLLKQVDFPLPESMIDIYMNEAVAQRRQNAEYMGKRFDDSKLDELKKSLEPSVREQVKSTVFLIAVAHKEGLDVQDSEVQNAVYRIAQESHQDFQQMWQFYQNSGLIFNLRDRLLADKGMNAIYAKAKVTMVPAKEPEEKKEKPADSEAK